MRINAQNKKNDNQKAGNSAQRYDVVPIMGKEILKKYSDMIIQL